MFYKMSIHLCPYKCTLLISANKLVTGWAFLLLPLIITHPNRASDISRGRGPAKFRYFREIPRNFQKYMKYREIRQKYFQIHVGKTYLILILAIRPVLFTDLPTPDKGKSGDP